MTGMDTKEYTLLGRDIDVCPTCFNSNELDNDGDSAEITVLFRRKRGFTYHKRGHGAKPRCDAITFKDDGVVSAGEQMARWFEENEVVVPEAADSEVGAASP